MKNLKFVRKISDFCSDLTKTVEVQNDIAKVIEEMKELTEQGEAMKVPGAEIKLANFSERNRSYLRRLNKSLVNFGEVLEDAKVQSSDIYSSIPADFSKLQRKCKLMYKSFSEVKELFDEVQDKVEEAIAVAAKEADLPIPTSIVPDSPTTMEKSEKLTVPASVNAPSEGVIQEAGDISVPQSVNFSKNAYINALNKEILRKYAEFTEALEFAGESVEDVAEVTEDEINKELENQEAEGEDAAVVPVEDNAPVEVEEKEDIKEIVENAEDGEPTEEISTENGESDGETTEEFCGDFTELGDATRKAGKAVGDLLTAGTAKVAAKTGAGLATEAMNVLANFSEEDKAEIEEIQSRIIEEGVKALKGKNEVPVEEIIEACEELDEVVPGAGEAAVTTIENFAAIYSKCFSRTKNFSANEAVDEAKSILKDALDKIHDNEVLDVEDLSNKLEGLKEANPGVYEVVVEVVNNEADRKTPSIVKAMLNFSEGFEDIKEFVDDIKVANKEETGNEAIAELCDKCSKIDEETQKIMGGECDICDVKNFSKWTEAVKNLVNFSAEGPESELINGVKSDVVTLADDVVGELEDSYNKGIAITPSQDVIASDNEINNLIDKIHESTKLPTEMKSFSTIVCNSIKSIKCFSASDLDNKLGLLEQFAEMVSPEDKDEEGTEGTEVPEEVEDAVPPSELEANMDDLYAEDDGEIPDVEVKGEEVTVCDKCHSDPCTCEVEETTEITAPSDDEVVMKNFSTSKSSDVYGDYIFSIM